jgi:hypothetical protein
MPAFLRRAVVQRTLMGALRLGAVASGGSAYAQPIAPTSVPAGAAASVPASPAAVDVAPLAARDLGAHRADSVERRYAELVANANGQMATVQTVWGVLVGALGVLFAVGAIVGGIVLWRLEARSRREREQHTAELEALTAQYTTELQDLARQYQVQIEAARVGVEAQIADAKARLVAATDQVPAGAASAEAARLKGLIAWLEEQRAVLGRQTVTLDGDGFIDGTNDGASGVEGQGEGHRRSAAARRSAARNRPRALPKSLPKAVRPGEDPYGF